MSSGKIVLITLVAGIASVGAGLLTHRLLGQQQQAPASREASLIPRPQPLRTTLPALSLPDLDGRIQTSGQWSGKVLVLNFWATWCPPCRQEIPDFVRLQAELGQKGLQFVGIALDAPDAVRAFATEVGFNYPVLLGDEETIELSRQLGNRLQGLPFSAIFDRHGQLIHAQVGELRPDTIREKTAPLLAAE